LRRLNPGVGLGAADLDLRLDLYFQHFCGPELHTNLENVIKQILGDVKVRREAIFCFNQGYGSGLDPDSLTLWIRIRNKQIFTTKKV
jgi:hypothetical protein